MRSDLWNILEPVEVDPRVKSWKDVLRNLVYHANGDGDACPTIETIRAETGYRSRRAVIDALAGLERFGLIASARAGRGRGTKMSYRIRFDGTTINALSTSVDKSGKGEVTSPFLSTNDEVTSKVKNNGEVTSPLKYGKGEVTSPLNGGNGEVTSNPPTPPYIGQLNSSSSMDRNGEVTSPFVDNSAEDAAAEHRTVRAEKPLRGGNDGKCVPPRTGVMAILDQRVPVDYLALCKKPGWRPNDRRQTPPADFDEAKRAVIACAYRAKLSVPKAKEFWHYNAIRKWSAIDCGSTVAELAFAFAQRWLEDSPSEYWSEQYRRKRAAESRVIA